MRISVLRFANMWLLENHVRMMWTLAILRCDLKEYHKEKLQGSSRIRLCYYLPLLTSKTFFLRKVNLRQTTDFYVSITISVAPNMRTKENWR
jgi:hypothetical protein